MGGWGAGGTVWEGTGQVFFVLGDGAAAFSHVVVQHAHVEVRCTFHAQPAGPAARKCKHAVVSQLALGLAVRIAQILNPEFVVPARPRTAPHDFLFPAHRDDGAGRRRTDRALLDGPGRPPLGRRSGAVRLALDHGACGAELSTRRPPRPRRRIRVPICGRRREEGAPVRCIDERGRADSLRHVYPRRGAAGCGLGPHENVWEMREEDGGGAAWRRRGRRGRPAPR